MWERIGRRRMLAAGAAAFGSTSLPALAKDPVKTGTVDIEQVQVAFIGSGGVGGGTLHWRGKSYRFSVGGLGIGGFGVSRMQATGDVYDLFDLNHFPGAYGQARYGAAFGDKGGGKLWLQNPYGVMLSLKARREGLAVSLGADAVIIDFKK